MSVDSRPLPGRASRTIALGHRLAWPFGAADRVVRRFVGDDTTRPLGVAVRVVADALLVNTAFIFALAVRWIWLVGVEGGTIITRAGSGVVSAREALDIYLNTYASNCWLLTLICLSTFALSGFYTRGRAYRGRYKALIVVQAVSLSYVIFGALVYLSGGLLESSRGAILLSWALTTAMLIGARLWTAVWSIVLDAEKRHSRSTPAERQTERVLVIGGAGYIGSALIAKLLKGGYQVRLLDLLVYGTEPIADVLSHRRLELVRADFRQVDRVTEAMRDVDAVIHLGAIVGDPACALDEELTIEVNLMAVRMIAEVAKGMGVQRFVFASTCSVYGGSDEVLDERSALNPVSLYARSKIASERVLLSMAGSGFAPVILRFGTIYGLSGRIRFDLVVNLLTAKAVVDGQITVHGGDQWRPFVHVDDAALAVVKALEAPLAVVRNHTFNVGSDDQNYTIQQVAEIIHSLVPDSQLISSGADADRRNYRVNFSKIHRILGFASQWAVEDGVRQIVEAIASGRVSDYRDPMYSNVRFLDEEGGLRFLPRAADWAHKLISETARAFDGTTMTAHPQAFFAAATLSDAGRATPQSHPGERDAALLPPAAPPPLL